MAPSLPNVFPTLGEGAEVIARGWAEGRSLASPYRCDFIDGIWRLRDVPPKGILPRRDQWVSAGLSPAQIDRIIRSHGTDFFEIAALLPGRDLDPGIRDHYKALGYRLGFTQPLMAFALTTEISTRSSADIQPVMTAKLLDRVTKAARQRLLLPRHLHGQCALRLYAASVDGHLAGWVRSLRLGRFAWCTNMYVKAEYRRKGVATALLARMHEADRVAGATVTLLLASHDGAKLYEATGFQTLGLMATFTPRLIRNSAQLNR